VAIIDDTSLKLNSYGAGATRRSLVHNAYGYGLFTGGFGVHHGAIRLGATVLWVSSSELAPPVVADFGSSRRSGSTVPVWWVGLVGSGLEEGVTVVAAQEEGEAVQVGA
jgi:hypothetical protein